MSIRSNNLKLEEALRIVSSITNWEELQPREGRFEEDTQRVVAQSIHEIRGYEGKDSEGNNVRIECANGNYWLEVFDQNRFPLGRFKGQPIEQAYEKIKKPDEREDVKRAFYFFNSCKKHSIFSTQFYTSKSFIN